jgi:hypothetical protein
MHNPNYIPPFQFGKYLVEAWGHRSATGEGGTEMVWSIRVDDAWLGSLTTSPDLTAAELTKRIKHWVTQNLPK